MSELFKDFTDAVGGQPTATDSGARQTNGSYDRSDVSDDRISEAIAEYGLEPRPEVVAKVQGMKGDWQAKSGGCGLSVYANRVTTRGFTL
jgi:hypothetical protein